MLRHEGAPKFKRNRNFALAALLAAGLYAASTLPSDEQYQVPTKSEGYNISQLRLAALEKLRQNQPQCSVNDLEDSIRMLTAHKLGPIAEAKRTDSFQEQARVVRHNIQLYIQQEAEIIAALPIPDKDRRALLTAELVYVTERSLEVGMGSLDKEIGLKFIADAECYALQAYDIKNAVFPTPPKLRAN